MKLVELLMRIPPNQQGEICGFPDDIANAMVERGVAKHVEAKRVPRVRLDVDHTTEDGIQKAAEPITQPDPKVTKVQEPEEDEDPEDESEKQAKPGKKKRYVTKG